jgi:hypothetical protein
MAPFSSPLDYLGRVRRVNDKPLRGRFASLDTAATARGMAAIEEDGGGAGHGWAQASPESPGHYRAINPGEERSLAATRGPTDPQARPCDRLGTAQIPKLTARVLIGPAYICSGDGCG